MNSTDKKFQAMSQCWRRVALTQGVPATMVGAAEQSEMWNDAVARAVTEIDSLAAGDIGDGQRLIVHHSKAMSGRSASDSAKSGTRKADTAEYDARAALVSAALEAVTTPAVRRRLSGKAAIAVVVGVPSPAWVKPVEDFLDATATIPWSTFARDGSDKQRHKTSFGNDEIAKKLSAGRRVVGIAANPEAVLPSALLAAADLTITIEQPNGAVVLAAMRRCLRGRLPRRIDDAVVAGLEIEDFVSAMRAGSTLAQALQRLKIASRQRVGSQETGAPLLETAVEFGAAREWGLSLARDIADYRAGRLAWRDVDRGAVFFGPPGTGKSVIAGSIAQACGIPLIRASMSEFFSDNAGDLGAVIKSQRAAFARAASMAPVLLLLDECDAIPNRKTLSPRGADWWLPVINDLLLLLDATLGSREGIVVCGATNRIEAVDAALLRPGRLERAIEIGPPELPGVINILRYQLASDLKNIDLTEVARLAEGSTAAEIMDIVRGARRAARHAGKYLTLQYLRAQIVGAADEPPAFLRRISIHEAAHAVTAAIIPVGKVVYIKLGSRGHSAGHTRVDYFEGDLPTLASIEDRVAAILAGGVAERLFLGAASTGSGGPDDSDLGVATGLLAVLHTSTSVMGTLFHRCSSKDALATVRIDPALRNRVERHLRELEERACELVQRHRDSILAVADELAVKRHLTGDAVISIIERVQRPTTAKKKSLQK
jgi:cell division protease FtsH